MPTLSVTVVVSLVGTDLENSGLSVTKRLTALSATTADSMVPQSLTAETPLPRY